MIAIRLRFVSRPRYCRCANLECITGKLAAILFRFALQRIIESIDLACLRILPRLKTMRQKVQSVKIKGPLNWNSLLGWESGTVTRVLKWCESYYSYMSVTICGKPNFYQTFCFLSFQYCKLFPLRGCFGRANRNILVFITGWKYVVVCHELSHFDDYA